MSGKTTTSKNDSTEQRSQNKREELVSAVTEDEKLGIVEKETTIKFAKPDNRVLIYTEEGGLMRRLLQHPEFQIRHLRVTTEDSWGARIGPDDFDGGSITGVDGWLPIGVLSLKTTSRTTSQHAAIVSERVLREGE
jgi:hypothetical protein